MPGPGDFCHGCNRLMCQCPLEPEHDRHYGASYEAGYDACLADGYSERPLTEWVYLTGSRCVWDASAGRLVHHMTLLRFAELTWRHHHRSAAAYARWFERQVGFDLGGYLAGYDDAGCGLPSAVADPDAHARAEAALDGRRPPHPGGAPVPEAPEPEAVGPRGEGAWDEDWVPF